MARLPFDRNINPFMAFGLVFIVGAFAADVILKAVALIDFSLVDPIRDIGL